MAKRPTIGKDPFDLRLWAGPLDAVIPDLRRPSQEQPLTPAEEVEALKVRLAAQEAEIQALRAELARLKGGPPEPASGSRTPEPRWVTLRKLGKI
jgi:hypothetical protein